MSPREVVLRAIASDDIDESGVIVIKLDSLREGDEDGLVPPVDDDSIIRMDFSGGFLIQKCTSRPKQILVNFYSDVHSGSSVPPWLVHFLVKTVFRTCWDMFLDAAEGVRDGKRQLHVETIQEKKLILYDWVFERTNEMLSSTKSGIVL